MRITHFKRKRGMTLIEVIIAIAILAIMAIGFLSVFSSNFKMLVNAKHLTVDTFKAQKEVEEKIEDLKNKISITPIDITDPEITKVSTMKIFGKNIDGYNIKKDIISESSNKHGEINVFVANKKIEYPVPVVDSVSLEVRSNLGIVSTTEINLNDDSLKLKAYNTMSADRKSQDAFLMNVYKWYVSFESIEDPVNPENYSLFKEWNEAKVPTAYNPDDPNSIPNIREGYDEFKFSDYAIDEEKKSKLFENRYIIYSVTPYSKIGRIGKEKFSNPILIKK